MQMTDALGTYTILTVGEGLVSQIPALLVSVATGIIVTRAASDAESNLGMDVTSQLFSNPRALMIVGALLTGMSLVPDMPKLPFLAIGGLLIGGSYMLRRVTQTRLAAAGSPQAPGTPLANAEPENFGHLLRVDPICVEIGYGLVSLADADSGGNLLARITLVRRQIATDLGIVVPAIRIRDDLQLPSDAYVIRLRGVEVARGEVRANRLMAMNPGTVDRNAGEIAGVPAVEPAFGLPALWISADERERAELLGYTVVDPTSVITTHLSEVIRQHAPSILTRQDVQALLDGVKAEHPALVNELIPEILTLGDIQHVLQHLLRERVPVRDLITILEALADSARMTRDVDQLGERVRQALGRAICRQYVGMDGRLGVLTLSPQWQHSLAGALQATDQNGGSVVLALDTQAGTRLVQALAREMERVAAMGYQPVLLCSARLRLALRRFTERALAALVILAYNEVAPQVEVTTLGVVGEAHGL
jgi:flagellar biosynthesis protein FlhA